MTLRVSVLGGSWRVRTVYQGALFDAWGRTRSEAFRRARAAPEFMALAVAWAEAIDGGRA